MSDDNIAFCAFRHKQEKRMLLRYLKRISYKNGSIIELGCGSGRWLIALHKMFKNLVGVDFSDNLLEVAKNEIKKRKIKNISLVKKNVMEISKDKRFDVVYLSGVTQYLNDKDFVSILKKIKKIAGEDSIIITRDTLTKGREMRGTKQIYRNKKEFIKIFEVHNFKLEYSFRANDLGAIGSAVRLIINNEKSAAKIRRILIKIPMIWVANRITEFFLMIGLKIKNGFDFNISIHQFNIFSNKND